MSLPPLSQPDAGHYFPPRLGGSRRDLHPAGPRERFHKSAPTRALGSFTFPDGIPVCGSS